jgi:hypothetical protein
VPICSLPSTLPVTSEGEGGHRYFELRANPS